MERQLACVVLPLEAQTPWGPSTTTGLRGSLPGPVLPPPQGAPRLSPGTIPLQGPPSLERSSRCRSDAGRCRAQRDHCKTLAGCHCRGECPSGEGWKHQKKKSQALAPKVKIPLAPHLHSMVNSGGAAHHWLQGIVFRSPRYHPMLLYPGSMGHCAETQSCGIRMVDLPASPFHSTIGRKH